MADDGVREERPLPVVDVDGVPEFTDGDGGVKRGTFVSCCGARGDEVGEAGWSEDAAQRKMQELDVSITLRLPQKKKYHIKKLLAL